MEKPPEENEAEVSGTPCVAPTEVMLFGRVSIESEEGDISGWEPHNGHPDGKVGTKFLQLADWEPATPPSPEANKIDTPRAPSCWYALQSWLQGKYHFSARILQKTTSTYVARLEDI